MNHVAGRGIGVGPRLAMGVIAVATVTQAGATSAPDADAILQRAFDNYRAGSSATSVAMTVHRPDWERHLDLEAWTRGQAAALVRFVAPAKDAGNATLKLGRDTWVFNPKLNQVIKSSRAEESHPHPLLEPDVNVAIHPAPDVQPCFKGAVRE